MGGAVEDGGARRFKDWELEMTLGGSLLAKWLWRFFMELNALWYRAILSRYGLYNPLNGFQVVVLSVVVETFGKL